MQQRQKINIDRSVRYIGTVRDMTFGSVFPRGFSFGHLSLF